MPWRSFFYKKMQKSFSENRADMLRICDLEQKCSEFGAEMLSPDLSRYAQNMHFRAILLRIQSRNAQSRFEQICSELTIQSNNAQNLEQICSVLFRANMLRICNLEQKCSEFRADMLKNSDLEQKCSVPYIYTII